MADQQSESRRIVVETPNARREVSHSETVQYPERSGVSSTALAAIVVGVVVLAAVVILFVMSQNRPDTVNANTAQQQQPPQTTIVQQPAQQPPVIVQQPAPATQPAPIIINQQPAPAPGGATTSGPDDGTIQAAIDKKLTDSPALSTLGITATVMSGKVTLMGTVKSEAQKSEVERTIRNVKGVKTVDNQLSVG